MIFPFWSFPAIAVIVWALWFLQRKFPVEPKQSSTAVISDWKLAGTGIGINQLIAPVTTASGMMIVNAMGGGWFHLDPMGGGFCFP
jgi:hypothetical protein